MFIVENERRKEQSREPFPFHYSHMRKETEDVRQSMSIAAGDSLHGPQPVTTHPSSLLLPPSHLYLDLLLLHLLPAFALVAGIWVIPSHYGFHLVDHPQQTLGIAGVSQFIISCTLYTVYSLKQKRCPTVWQAIWRSIIFFLTGSIIAILVAIIFGAPLDLMQCGKTAMWAQLISSLVTVPAGIILGPSWSDWQRLFAFSRPKGLLEYSSCIPAHGAVIGAWFGAWPMPLDWERPWQEWPVSVTYGTTVGFITGEFLSLFLILFRNVRDKQD